MLDPYEDFAGNTMYKIRRFDIMDNTMIWIADEPQLLPGQGAITIGTPDGGALPIHLSNG